MFKRSNKGENSNTKERIEQIKGKLIDLQAHNKLFIV